MIFITFLITTVSCDASDKMLKYALKERWERRKERNFDNWSEYKKVFAYYNRLRRSYIIKITTTDNDE